jgi:hypothetical protein
MYVVEEPGSGIVPMNHSNKIEHSMAESKEESKLRARSRLQGFFDNLDKAWMIKLVEHRVADRALSCIVMPTSA